MVECEVQNPSTIALRLDDATFAMRFDPSQEQPDPLNSPNSIIMGLLVAKNFTLGAGVNILHLEGAMINPDTLPGLNPQTSEEVRGVMGAFVTNFLKSNVMSIGITGYSSRDEFVAHDEPPADKPSPFPTTRETKWLSAGLHGLQHVVTYRHDPDRPVELQSVFLLIVNQRLIFRCDWKR